jgi:SAM-dependent methyltransferase
MSLAEQVHEAYVHDRRIRRLCHHLAGLLPHGARVLDVGCGDGRLDSLIQARRPDVQISGIDVLVRPNAAIPVESFDGRTIPHDQGSFDAVMFVDVLHHADDAAALLREAARVARQAVVLKDHTADGPLAVRTLRFMDRVGNARHGVALPYDYWARRRWLDAFAEIGLEVEVWRKDLGLYPWPASMIFGRSLHFVARLRPSTLGPP